MAFIYQMKKKWWKAYIVAGLLDLIDFLWLPLEPYNIAYDAVQVAVMYRFIGNYAFINVAEAIPATDFSPTCLITTFMAHRKIGA